MSTDVATIRHAILTAYGSTFLIPFITALRAAKRLAKHPANVATIHSALIAAHHAAYLSTLKSTNVSTFTSSKHTAQQSADFPADN